MGRFRRLVERVGAEDEPREERRANRGPQARRRGSKRDLVRDVVTLAAIIIAVVAAIKASGQSSTATDKSATASGKASTAQEKANQAVDVASATDERLDRNERRDRDDLRAALYRVCIRGKVDRAFAHSRIAASLRGRARERVLRDLERLDGLPILSCRANLRGRGARPLSRRQQRAFMRAWERHRLSNAALGICPRSRVPSPIRSPERC